MKRSLILVVCIFTLLISFGQIIPNPANPPRLVNDFAGILSTAQKIEIEDKLVSFDRNTSNQIAVVTITDLQNMDVTDYATKLFEKWGIGGSKNDNGVLVLVKPKTNSESGRVAIITGYGLEGPIPDILAGRIIDYDMIPYFERNDYFGGINAAINTLMGLTEGEFTKEQYIEKHESKEAATFIASMVVIFFVIFLLSLRRRKGETVTSEGKSIPPTIFIGGLPFLGRGRGGGFGGFSGGGGFGGFGGGMTGGGGASGSW